jgi:hypothetical protein
LVFNVDTGQPTADEPDAAIVEGTLGSAIPVKIDWNDAFDSVSGVASREFERKVNTGVWQAVNPEPSAVITAEALKIGSTYRYHQRATDFAENVGGWSSVLARRPVLKQETASNVVRSANWKRKAVTGSSGGYVLRSSTYGAWIRASFTGSSVGWVSTVGPTMGQARIYVDGQSTPAATVDLFRSAAAKRQIVWAHNFGSIGTHTIEIRVAGTSGHPRVDFDGLVFLGRV